jgi:hypothetical protein
MSNAMAVPTVTAAITSIVQQGVSELGLSPGPQVTPGPPDEEADGARVGVSLYRVSRNPSRYEEDLPTRSSTGDLRQTPRVALDLHYLLTFRGTTEWETAELLARAAATLHATPILTAAWLEQAVVEHPEVGGNDLAAADEPVRLSADCADFDDVVRFWTLYAPGSFTVTLSVVAGPVIVDADGTPPVVLPVHAVASAARPLAGPRLDTVAGPDGAGAPVRSAAPMPQLDLLGSGLTPRPGETGQVLVDGAAVPFTSIDDTHLTISSDGLAPGVHTVQVNRIQPPPDPALSTTTIPVGSDVQTIQVTPTLTASTATTSGTTHDRSGSVTADVIPALGAAQRVVLLLDSQSLTPPVSLALPATPAAPSTTVTFPVADAEAGTYRAILQVDGVRSLPALDASGHYIATVVTL